MHFKTAPHLRGRLDVAYVHLVRLPIILRALTFFPLPNVLTTKIGLWGEESEMDIECFHSRGQHLCKFIGTKESVCIRKELNSQRTGLGHQHGRRFIVVGHQYGRRDVM